MILYFKNKINCYYINPNYTLSSGDSLKKIILITLVDLKLK